MSTNEPPGHPTDLDPRVALAAERTVLAWFRTGLALMGLGFVVARLALFLREAAPAAIAASTLAASGKPVPAPAAFDAATVGVVIVCAGILVNTWASVRHVGMIRQLERGGPFHASPRGPVAVGVGTAVLGVIVIAVLLSALVR